MRTFEDIKPGAQLRGLDLGYKAQQASALIPLTHDQPPTMQDETLIGAAFLVIPAASS